MIRELFKTVFTAFFGAVTFIACAPKPPVEDPEILKKIKFDLSQIDENGLRGPANGKVSVSYEFCIPADETVFQELKKTDPSAEKNAGKGRVGCSKNEWLVIGDTHQKHWRSRLYKIASRPDVREIREVFWE